MRGQYDICLTTYEKATMLALVAPHLLDGVGTVVIDEAQTLADASRGANLEFLLTLLRVRRRTGAEPQLIALSAVIGESGGLERWLGGRLLRHDQRPVPLDEGVLCGDGALRWLPTDGDAEQREPFIAPRYGRGTSQDWIIPLVERLVAEDDQAISSFATPRAPPSAARAISPTRSGSRPARPRSTSCPLAIHRSHRPHCGVCSAGESASTTPTSTAPSGSPSRALSVPGS
jgi:hypothetical protein